MAVTVSTDSNFQELLDQNDRVVVKYFANWCGSCKLFAPKYRRLSEDERFSDIVFLDINAEENEDARKKAGVNNLPFFATFKNGKLVEGIPTSKEDKVVEMLDNLNNQG
jgi:thiol-disulfide isomerase/thioredoxin